MAGHSQADDPRMPPAGRKRGRRPGYGALIAAALTGVVSVAALGLTRFDYVYMHLKGRPSVREGDRIETGERIGRVGRSGNASGCHLHFELWSAPGWFEGGHHLRSVTRKLHKWDRWS